MFSDVLITLFAASPSCARAPAVRRTSFGTAAGVSVAAVPKGFEGVQGETRLLLAGGVGALSLKKSFEFPVKKANVQHRTLNTQHRIQEALCEDGDRFGFHWTLEVGRSAFDVRYLAFPVLGGSEVQFIAGAAACSNGKESLQKLLSIR